MLKEQIRVVIDTNIIISAAISLEGYPAKVFEFLLENKIVNYTTKEIIKEIEEVLDRSKIKRIISTEYKKFILENFKKNSIIINPYSKERVVLEDSDDDKFINCAIDAKADIISGDKHLLKLKQYKGIKILNAKGLLEI